MPLSICCKIEAATFNYSGKFGDVVAQTRVLPPYWDWIGGIWEVEVNGNLEKEVSLSSDLWIRYYSITSVSFAMTFRYKTDDCSSPNCEQPNTIIELYKHVLNTSNFNLSFNSWENINDFNSSFIVESKGIYGPGVYRYQIFLKYDEQATIQTPKGSMLKLGGGVSGINGGFSINHFSDLPIPALWPGNAGFFVPTGYGPVTYSDTDLNLNCHVNETETLTAGFTYSGYHDSTIKKFFSLFYVNTAMVDQKPLVGGLIKFVASDSGEVYEWDFDGGEVIGNDGSPAKRIVKFTDARKYTVTLNVISSDKNLMSQQAIDLSLLPGDLIFIRTPGLWAGLFNLINNRYTHVGMYIGDGMMIEAAKDALAGNTKGGVQKTPLFNRWCHPTETFATAYRVKNVTDTSKAGGS